MDNEVAVYVSKCPRDDILFFVRGRVGSLELAFELEEYEIYKGAACYVALFDVNEYQYLCILGNAEWLTDIELARDIVGELGGSARCDPGPEFPDISPSSDTFFEIDPNGERLVVWI